MSVSFRLGNLTPEQFANRVGSTFTPGELQQLASLRSGRATLTGPDDFHIFDDPAITVTIGSTECEAIAAFKAAHARTPFNRPVRFDLDNSWETNDV